MSEDGLPKREFEIVSFDLTTFLWSVWWKSQLTTMTFFNNYSSRLYKPGRDRNLQCPEEPGPIHCSNNTINWQGTARRIFLALYVACMLRTTQSGPFQFVIFMGIAFVSKGKLTSMFTVLWITRIPLKFSYSSRFRTARYINKLKPTAFPFLFQTSSGKSRFNQMRQGNSFRRF